MASLKNPILKEVFDFLDNSFSKSENSIIFTIPGLGLSHLLKQYSQSSQAAYIDSPEIPSARLNILDFDFQKHPDSIMTVDKYYRHHRSINPKNTFVFIINTPSIFNSPEFQNSYFASHSYNHYWFHSWTKPELTDFIQEQQIKITPEQIDNLFILSGGIIRLAKYLLFHPELLSISSFDCLQDNDELNKLLLPTFQAISATPQNLLNKLGLYNEGKYTSSIINWFFENKIIASELNLDIRLMPDLSFSENSKKSVQTLTKSEKDLLEYLLSHDNLVTRDQISEIKWGKDSFEKFSDQAINKAVSRLNYKLSVYQIKPVNKIGYKLVLKNA